MKRGIALLLLALLAYGATSCRRHSAPVSKGHPSDEKAWKTFYAAVNCLQKEGDRKRAEVLFREVAEKYPKCRYETDCRELAALLEEMVKEDRKWVEPENPTALPLDNRIAYYVYHLRNVNCYQVCQPGQCYLLGGPQRKETYNAAIHLKQIGAPAIPALIELLDDRRPTRSVGFWRDFDKSRTVLRYQDAAIQILNELLPAPFYRPSSTGAYFSNEKPEVRAKIIASIKSWRRKGQGKSDVERKWLAVEEDLGIYPILSLLEELALKDGEKERVLAKLHKLASKKDPIQLPQISTLMCQLGDFTRFDEVATAYFTGKYEIRDPVALPDDGAANSNALYYALRQLILYGNDTQLQTIRKDLNMKDDSSGRRDSLLETLVDLVSDRRRELPKGYDKKRFPLQLLMDAFELKDEWKKTTDLNDRWRVGRCYEAAGAIQNFVGIDFGYNEKGSMQEKDRAIDRILSWWHRESKTDRKQQYQDSVAAPAVSESKAIELAAAFQKEKGRDEFTRTHFKYASIIRADETWGYVTYDGKAHRTTSREIFKDFWQDWYIVECHIEESSGHEYDLVFLRVHRRKGDVQDVRFSFPPDTQMMTRP